MWIGTFGGLNLFDGEQGFIRYTEDDGLLNVVINGILDDKNGNLWLSTDNGLFQFNPEKKTCRQFDVKDGLPNNEFVSGSFLKGKDGRLYFGTISGYFSFFPEMIQTDSNPPFVQLTDFLLFNESVPLQSKDPTSPLEKPIELTSELTLSYKDSLITFEFAGIHHKKPMKNRYAYKLVGWDDDWVFTDARKRFATYTRLDPGSYTFRVKASNSDGVWNETGRSLKLNITPPPWKTWWAYSIYTLLILAIIVWFVQSQRFKVKQKQKELDLERKALTAEKEAREKEKHVSERLKKVDKMKDEFLANTSHELRTPINGIIGIVESLVDGVTGKLPEKTISNLKMVVTSGHRLANLVNDILDHSKLKHQDIGLQIKPIDMRSLTDVVIVLSSHLIEGKDLKITNKIQEDIPPVDADENRIQQIMHNLIDNAIKFTDKGEVSVSSEIIDGRLNILIKDTGIGISEDKFNTIFQSFEQADGSTDREYGGTGLGLTVSRQLVKLHGSDITVESEVGEGSTFSFSLALSTEQIESKEKPADLAQTTILTQTENEVIHADEAAQAMINSEISIIDGLHRPHILVVDDEPVNRQILHNQLAMKNCQITEAQSGQTALAHLEQQKNYDLVLLDVMMPKMSGYEVCQEIRQKYNNTELPVVMLTAKNQSTDLVTGLDSGANDYITKPFSKIALLARIKTQLQLSKQGRDLKEYSEQLEQKVEKRTEQLSEANSELSVKNEQISNKNKQIHDSLQYAVTMQHSLIPDENILKQSFKDHFVLWEPRDVVSGDIYFCYPSPSGCLLAVIDCTGHGVPGAFMTMIAGSGFQSILNEKYLGNPAGMLTALNQFVTHTLRQELKDSKSDNGMDMGLCCINRTDGTLTYAGAKSSLLVVDNNEIVEVKGDRQSVGYKKSDLAFAYTNHSVTISPSASYYLLTDGFVDQGGGKKGFGFGKRRFREMLLANYQKPFGVQKEIYHKTLIDYQGDSPRRDDVTVFGFG